MSRVSSRTQRAISRRPPRSWASTARLSIGCAMYCPNSQHMVTNGTFTDKLLHSCDLSVAFLRLGSVCGKLPHIGKAPQSLEQSCKLLRIRGLDRVTERWYAWQSGCSRDPPTARGAHHEQRRRNTHTNRHHLFG